jgi:hypothetical protein
MARIVIKDLKEGVELDRAAMRRISGGGNRGWRNPTQSILFHQRPAWFDPFNLSPSAFDPNR